MHFLKIQRKWFAYYKQNYPLFDNHLKNFYRLSISYTFFVFILFSFFPISLFFKTTHTIF